MDATRTIAVKAVACGSATDDNLDASDVFLGGSITSSGSLSSMDDDAVNGSAEQSFYTCCLESINKNSCSVCAKFHLVASQSINPSPKGAQLGYHSYLKDFQPRESVVVVDVEVAKKIAKDSEVKSNSLQLRLKKEGLYTRDSKVARFYKSEIFLGQLKGQGAYCSIFEIKDFDEPLEEMTTTSTEERYARQILASHAQLKTYFNVSGWCFGQTKIHEAKQSCYALKSMIVKPRCDPKEYARTALDLVLEGQLLLALDHPNIVGIHGLAKGGTKALESGRPEDYFLVLDMLPEMFHDRLQVWRSFFCRLKLKLFVPWLKPRMQDQLHGLLLDRLSVACDIASAIEYMHDHRIINRDIKPTNIGFDIRRNVKIFDLGLARVLPDKKYCMHDGYQMSHVGTPCTMAPEVSKNCHYGLNADVYSFGIVLWEILSLSTSFEYLRQLEQPDGVTVFKLAPGDVLPLPACSCWSHQLQDLVKSCLAYDQASRPSMQQARLALDDEIDRLGTDGLKKTIHSASPGTRRSSSMTMPEVVKTKSSTPIPVRYAWFPDSAEAMID